VNRRLELLGAKARGFAERLLQDVRTALRGMRRNPGYASAVVLVLALGIGLNAEMYGLLSRLFLQAPPHVEDADGIHRVWVRGRGDMLVPPLAAVPRDRVRWADFAALAADAGQVVHRLDAVLAQPGRRGQHVAGSAASADPHGDDRGMIEQHELVGDVSRLARPHEVLLPVEGAPVGDGPPPPDREHGQLAGVAGPVRRLGFRAQPPAAKAPRCTAPGGRPRIGEAPA